jgi:hypothetical protein
MTAVSVSISRGQFGSRISDFTVGSLAPNAGDVEVRFNVLDAQGKNMNDQDIWILLEQIGRALLNGGTKVNITTQPSGPPN